LQQGDFRLGVEGEMVDADDARQAVMFGNVAVMALKIDKTMC
jgi:hypothetical protein